MGKIPLKNLMGKKDNVLWEITKDTKKRSSTEYLELFKKLIVASILVC